ncbi:hypothetical protein HYU90_01745 [Candidatus Collierbacteria bacterium]|nr:hypothetical protein [Candidatus Collierbacteria bacterium]
MDNSRSEVEAASVRPDTAMTEAEQDRLSDLAHNTSVEIVKAIGEIRLRESDSYFQTALALIDSKDENQNHYILLIVNEGMRLAKEQWSRPWDQNEMVPVEQLPHWDPSGILNKTMTYQQQNEMVGPTPRLLNDVMMPRSNSSIRLAEAALRPKKNFQAKLDALLGKPQPTQAEVMAAVVKAYAYDMAVYFRREMQKPQAPTTISSTEDNTAPIEDLKNLGGGEEVRA